MKKIVFLTFALCLIFMCGNTTKVNAASGDVKINSANFPDAQVRKCVAKYADKNKNGVLSKKEISSCIWIKLKGTKSVPIQSLKGMQIFTKLRCIDFYFPTISCLNESNNIKNLERLDICASNETDLDLSAVSVKELFIAKDIYSYEDIKNLKSVHVSKELQELYIDSDTLEKIETTKLSSLKKLTILCATLKDMNLGDFPNLRDFSIAGGKIDLDFKKNPQLESVNIQRSDATLDFSKNRKLYFIEVYGCSNLKRVILPKNSAKAQSLDCNIRYCNNFSQCNFNDAKNLAKLEIPYCGFKSIDVSKCKKMTWFCSDYSKKLVNIKLAKNSQKAPRLWLNAYRCRCLTSCNFNDARNLQEIYAEKTNFKKLNLTKLKKLKRLYCKGCKNLKKVYIPKKIKIKVSKDRKVKLYKR